MVGNVFRDSQYGHYVIDMGKKQYLTNTLQVVEFTSYKYSFHDGEIPKAGEVGSIWFELEDEANMSLINYRASLKPIEEPVWVNI